MTTPRAERPDMSDYGVPADLADVLPWSWAEERLLRNKNFWVITASAKGRPHALPVWGVWMPEWSTFAFSCSPNARKARNIRANPQVAFAIDDTVECVSVEGTAHELADRAAARSGRDLRREVRARPGEAGRDGDLRDEPLDVGGRPAARLRHHRT